MLSLPLRKVKFMVKLPPFIVHCERIGRRNTYYVRFQYNVDLINKIKSLPEETRKWNAAAMAWEISIHSLFLLIKKFKGSDKIHFDFGNEDSRKVFIEQIKKVQIAEAEKRKFIEELNIKKEHWVQYKEELEKDYIKYSDKLHSLLNDGIKLYPHQIVAAMFMNVTRNTLISHEMGLGKTASSILYVEMNGFKKVIVITPNSLKFNYYYEVKKFTNSQAHIVGWKKNTCSLEDAKYVIINYDFFNPAVKSGRFQAKWKKLGIDKIDCVILDECFTYDTKISTNIGDISIGEIVEKKLDVKVLSYNHKLKKIELKSIKRYLYRGIKKVVLVRLSDGTTIRCTPDHKFYSFDRDEYISIKDFKYGEKIIKKKKISDSDNTLQDKYWDSQFKISNRSGWEFSQDQEMEIFGQEEDGNFEIIWVESIGVLESGDRREFGGCSDEGERVYDLEIAHNHNFFANGILVHNCQKIKNNNSNTYKNYKRTFSKKIFNGEKESKIFLSGTPAPNRAYELYTVLNQISQVDFPTKKYFYEYYCGMTRSEMGWGYVADEMDTKFEELFHKIAPFTHRKRKIDALKDLPDKTYQRIILEMTAQEEKTYNDIENSVANDFVLHPTGNPLTIMIRLRQYLGLLKINHIVELVDSILETGEKVVIVDYYKETLYELHKRLDKISALHTGDQTVEERSDIVKKFQDPNSDLKVFLASIQTANYGLTLTAASKLFIITLPYSVGEYDQVSDRLHRIGQKDSVNIYPLIFPDTIDDYVYSSIENKRKEIVKVMDNEDYKSQVNESVLSDVINKIKQKHGK